LIKLLLLVVAFLFIIIFANLLTKIRKQEKYNILISSIVVLSFLAYYTHLQNLDRKSNFDMIVSFNQDKTLYCNDINITNKEFNYVSGTSSFIGKRDTKYYGITLQLEDCKESK
jgi:hypothetical protein